MADVQVLLRQLLVASHECIDARAAAGDRARGVVDERDDAVMADVTDERLGGCRRDPAPRRHLRPAGIDGRQRLWVADGRPRPTVRQGRSDGAVGSELLPEPVGKRG